ncbi:MAG: hypothetical protein ACLQDM_27565, partial [Bradyrhizobium sp.]
RLAVVDVGDNGDVAKLHVGSICVRQWGSAISPENRDPLFRITLENLGVLKWAQAPKKDARPKGPGTPYSLRRNIVRNCRKTMRCLRFG